MIIVAVVLWAVGLWYYMSIPVIVDKFTERRWKYPVAITEVSFIRPDVTVHLTLSSNVSTTVYLEHWIYNYRSELLEIASNTTSLDTRFVGTELGVRSTFFTLLFIPATRPMNIHILITYETPNNFYYIYIFLGMAFAGLGIAATANTAWKRRLEARTKEQTSKAQAQFINPDDLLGRCSLQTLLGPRV